MKSESLIFSGSFSISTLNFILGFVGFQLVTSLFLSAIPGGSGSTFSVTIPYRAFALIVSLAVIVIYARKFPRTLPFPLIVFLFFWGLWIIRMFSDVFIHTDLHITGTSQLWLYVFGISLPAIFSIILSYQHIELNKSLWWVVSLIAVVLVITLLTNHALLLGKVRLGANAAISSIAFGHLGATSIILGLYAIFTKKPKRLYKFLLILLILLGAFCMLRAGSRGPILALFIVLLFWVFSRGRNFLWGSIVIALVFIITAIFLNQILILMGNISPTIEWRMREAIYGLNLGGRNPYYVAAFNAFLDNPLFGKHFVVIFPDGSYDYSHNIILDALMGLGIVGGVAMIYIIFSAFRKSYHLINTNDRHFWICLLLIQQIMLNMLSSAFYYNPLLSLLLTFVFLYYYQQKNDKSKDEPLVVNTLE